MKRILFVLPLVLLCWAPAAHAQQTLPGICAIRGIAYGTTPATGSITVAGGQGCHRFTGAAGDIVRVRLIRTSGTLDPTVGIAPPGGGTGCTARTDDEFTCAIRTAGEHTMVVHDAAATATGTYALSIQRLNDPVGCTTLAFGAAPSVGTIAGDGGTGCHRFVAASGDRVHVRAERTSGTLNPLAEVLNPDGTRACPPTTADESTCLLSGPLGTYTILTGDAAGTNAGDYAIAVQRLNNPVGCTTLAFATLPTPAAIGAAREVDCFRFDGADGDLVRVSAITLAGNAAVAEVVGPDGSTRCRTFGPRFNCLLDRTGVHTLFVVSDSRVQTSTYSVLIQRLNDPVACRSTAFGAAPIAASVTWAAETDCYRLDGDAGTVARLVFTGPLRQHVVVLRPDGTQRCEARYTLPVLGFNCTFDVSGPHTILVEDDSGTLAGGYTIATQRADVCSDSLVHIGWGAERGSIATAGEVDCWSNLLTLDAGRRVEVRLTRESGALDPVVEVLRSDGTRLCGPTTADEFDCVTDTRGRFRLLVGGTAAGATGIYEIELS